MMVQWVKVLAMAKADNLSLQVPLSPLHWLACSQPRKGTDRNSLVLPQNPALTPGSRPEAPLDSLHTCSFLGPRKNLPGVGIYGSFQTGEIRALKASDLQAYIFTFSGE